MKRYLFIIVGLLFLVGCSTKEENEKYAYLEYKNDLESQDVYDEEGDMEIAIKIDDKDLGSEPIVVKSTVYEQLYIVNS